jgi:hypothetical protein
VFSGAIHSCGSDVVSCGDTRPSKLSNMLVYNVEGIVRGRRTFASLQIPKLVAPTWSLDVVVVAAVGTVVVVLRWRLGGWSCRWGSFGARGEI